MKLLHVLLKRAHARLRRNEGGFTLSELLIVVVISGVMVAALASSFVVSTRAATSSEDRLDRSRDAQQVSTYFLTDAQNASYFSKDAVVPGLTTCSHFGVGNNVAVFKWDEGGVRKDAIYGTSGTELVRRYCEQGEFRYDVSLVKNIGTPAPQVTCPTAPCSANSPYLEMAVTETTATFENAFSYTVRADPRTTGSGPTGPMEGIAIFVGNGGITTGGSKTTISVPEGVVTVDGKAKCNGDSEDSPAFLVADGFFPETYDKCAGASEGGTAPTDPLLELNPPTPKPAKSSTAPSGKKYVPPSSNACGSSQPTYQPGLYPDSTTLENGCLASGTYWFESGANLSGVTSADLGVHIYIEDGGGSFSGVSLAPLSTGEQAGVTVFQARGVGDELGTHDDVRVEGTIYLPSGVLHVQSEGGYLEAGSINVLELVFKGNSKGVIII